LARLFVEGPHQTWFNIFQYQTLYRHANWGNTAGHDLGEMSGWLDSSQALVLLVLCVCALWFLRRPKSNAEAEVRDINAQDIKANTRAEFYLCGWMALGLGLEEGLAHPTFTRYFVLTIPFAAMLAGPGLYQLTARLTGGAPRRAVPVLLLTVLTAMGAGRAIYDNSEVYRWRDMQKVAAKIRQVTPPGAALYANEPLYFLMHWPPPEGMQFAYSRDLDLPAAESAQLHIVRQKDLDKQVEAGRFATVVVCTDQDTVDRLKLTSLYRKNDEVEYCKIFWDWGPGK